jgi:GH25 family lysozyme M1 (1,4-beta-N-acetylmuramidase)
VDNLAVADVKHIYLKASEGASFTDPTYLERRLAAEKVTLHYGAYHFARPDQKTSPFSEAKLFLNVIGTPQPGRLRPCLDLEVPAAGQLTLRQWAEDFASVIHGTLGYWPVLYGSTSFIAPLRAESQILRSCAWWRAEYGRNDGNCYPLAGGAMGAAIHQYTSVAHFAGISGATDASVILSESGIYVPGLPPKPIHALTAAWRWAQWYVGIGRYKGRGHYAHEHGVPNSNPPPLPASMVGDAWACVKWYTSHGVGA